MFDQLSSLPVGYLVAFAALIGLMIGSFLNVVIYRYPILMKFEWSKQSYEWLNEKDYPESAPDGIAFPASRCGHCKTPLKLWHNLPVISFIFLRGKCAHCDTRISWRYPLVELLTAIMSGIVVLQFGWSLQTLFALFLTWALIALSFIDFDHKLLPDDIVLPSLWLGLAISLWPVFANTQDAILGCIAGYLSLWLVFQAFKLVTGKEGMGFGDFKLLAALGAWLGWQMLPQILLVSTLLGSVIGITLMLTKQLSEDRAIPFGPYIALAGWIAMLWGEQINQTYLRLFY